MSHRKRNAWESRLKAMRLNLKYAQCVANIPVFVMETMATENLSESMQKVPPLKSFKRYSTNATITTFRLYNGCLSVFIRIEGMGKEAATDARALGVAIPQLGKGEYHIEQTMNAEFGDEENFSLTFAGTWNRYKRVKQLTDAFGKEATKVSVKMTLRADFLEGLEVDNEEYQTIRDIFTTLGMGKLVVDAEPIGTGETPNGDIK